MAEDVGKRCQNKNNIRTEFVNGSMAEGKLNDVKTRITLQYNFLTRPWVRILENDVITKIY
jgi:hypothetical protein